MPSKVISLIRNVHFSGCDLVVGALAPDPESVDLWTWCQCVVSVFAVVQSVQLLPVAVKL